MARARRQELTLRDWFQFDVPTSSVSSASVSSHSRTSPYSGNDKKTASANALKLRCRALVSCGKDVATREISQNISSVSFRNTHRAVQRSRHLHGLPIAFSIARHSTARPRRRRGRLPASSFPRQPLGPKAKENKRDLILLPSRFGETSTRFERNPPRKREHGKPSRSARHATRGRGTPRGRARTVRSRVLDADDRENARRAAELHVFAQGHGTETFHTPHHDHLTRFLPLPPPPSHT